ncbi:hypothetical protein FPQ18DRAFT_49563 [Pyronema domesticum]|uniref:Similar to Uncharacterized protein C1F12.04c acc. no. Q10346 n=1 Tax=Pyronema omphalodes (strain CBS 100304) TaxID=1076935 RepID=U4LVP1_PYROM|nr:hypothetical protein FPQ18DRAFT_49563 [Pyronema domesticum]CCX34732.1 Similar to Uncharacterized protein C1F12.04c; acc. no. Q10346 [Pyronema omphalodes CBS 100304]
MSFNKRNPDVFDIVKSQLKLADKKIAHLHRLLQTPAGIDRVLNLLYYLATFTAPQLSRLASDLTVKLPTPIPLFVLTPSSAALNEASVRLRNLSARISDVRMFMRLFGLIGMYQWGKSTLMDPPKDKIMRTLVAGQVIVNTCYQVLENMAYLNKHAVLKFSKRTEGKMWLWSTRCWAAHITLEFLRLERVRMLKGNKGERDYEWIKTWIANAANAPLSLHWSMEKGLIPDTAVGAFGGVAGIIGLTDAWNKCA